ncbi:MAG TPA: bacillithiol biosynthesis cysteine-adding enzyme BshC [Cytophagaceae bacterium]|nr:bacillithiol biosynthesis cysteine-adding enzyme BshC [Cytophagaceae bacterium]
MQATSSVRTVPLQELSFFSKTFLDYISGNPKLSSFYGNTPEAENFAAQISVKLFTEEKRQTLVNALSHQYKDLSITKEVSANIASLLKPNTYTVTTGHQLNIFGGPLYFIYKIITTINTAKILNQKDPSHHIVPVFWMASEDHDFEEINHFNLFGKTWKWETEQKGAVGRFNPEGICEILDALPERIPLFEKAYRENKTLADATRYFVNELFGKDGLVILDADDKSLKKEFSFVVRDELTKHSSHALVEKTSAALEAAGYEAQVHARAINLFYLENGLRERILKEGDHYKINNTNLVFSEKEFLEKAENEPEKFSPNVVLRPLYQECILPNLAYLGGPAEVVYWLQLKAVFDHFKVPFPILMPRNFALWLNKANQQKLSKLSLDLSDLFVPADQLKNNYLLKITEAEFKLEQERDVLKTLFESIKEKAGAIDKTMEAAVLGELQKSLKILEDLEKRLKKAEERKNETVLTQLMNLKEKLFPGGGLQERSDNFLSFHLNNEAFLANIKNTFDPFHYSFYLLSE